MKPKNANNVITAKVIAMSIIVLIMLFLTPPEAESSIFFYLYLSSSSVYYISFPSGFLAPWEFYSYYFFFSSIWS